MPPWRNCVRLEKLIWKRCHKWRHVEDTEDYSGKRITVINASLSLSLIIKRWARFLFDLGFDKYRESCMCLQPTRCKAEWRVGLALAGRRGGGGEGAFTSCLLFAFAHDSWLRPLTPPPPPAFATLMALRHRKATADPVTQGLNDLHASLFCFNISLWSVLNPVTLSVVRWGEIASFSWYFWEQLLSLCYFLWCRSKLWKTKVW